MDSASLPSDVRPAAVDAVRTEDDRRVRYAEYGDPDGRPVTLFHGTPGSHRLAALFDEAARRRGVRLLALDRPGFGRSSPWPTRDLTATGAFVVPVLDAAGVSRTGVVGFSGGGPHALALAATHGDRVTSVDLVAGATPPSLAGPPPVARRLLVGAASTTPAVLAGLFRGLAWLAPRLPAAVVAQYTTSAGRAALPGSVTDLVVQDFREALAHTRRGTVTELRLLADDWDPSLLAVDHRVRLWHGGRDANVPLTGARRLRDRLPDARLTTDADADHLTTLLDCRDPVLDRHAGRAD
jgi:pimeloyl-ACP methyl ester carboxylesterase